MTGERGGRGPWARLLASTIVGDEGSARAELGRRLVRDGAVQSIRVETGELGGIVDGETVTIAADRLPPRIWTAISRFARGNRPLEAAIAGREQSVHLEHLLTVDWDAPLVPRREAISRSCTCPNGPACEHVAALAYAVADELDREPALLLRWRGCGEGEVVEEPRAEPIVEPAFAGDPWRGGELPAVRPPRPLPAGAVLKRLGPSGLRAGGRDLTEVLQRAYAVFGSDE